MGAVPKEEACLKLEKIHKYVLAQTGIWYEAKTSGLETLLRSVFLLVVSRSLSWLSTEESLQMTVSKPYPQTF